MRENNLYPPAFPSTRNLAQMKDGASSMAGLPAAEGARAIGQRSASLVVGFTESTSAGAKPF